MTRLFLLGVAVLFLSACGDDVRDAVPEEPETSAPTDRLAVPEASSAPEEPGGTDEPAPRVTVTDTLGAFDTPVAGLALWEHPLMAFASAVLAANGDAGLAIVPLDREVRITTLEGRFDGPVAIGYTLDASYMAAASGSEVMLYTVSDERAFTPIGSVSGQAAALCMIGDTLLVLGQEATAYQIKADGSAQVRFTLPANGATHCASTSERFLIVGADGPLRSVDVTGQGSLVDDAYDARPVAGLGAVTTEGGDALVYLSAGTLHVDGPGLGHVPVSVVRDGVTLPGATMLAAGSGNFGSVYRDGVVAMVANDELVLLPWAGVARAADMDGTSTVSPRPRAPVIPLTQIELELPDIQTTLDRARE